MKELIHQLLVRIGSKHPQAVMYPLIVAKKSSSVSRRGAANHVMDSLRQHSGKLISQAQMVSNELIRMAILWHEMWHEALEEASRLYFGEVRERVGGCARCKIDRGCTNGRVRCSHSRADRDFQTRPLFRRTTSTRCSPRCCPSTR